MFPLLILAVSVFSSCATIYLIDDAYEAYLETAPLREFIFKALCAASALVLSVALWLLVYLT